MKPNDLLCRAALPEDRPFLLDLWGRVFGDSPAYAARCLGRFAGEGNVLLAQQGAVPAAMLLAVPCQMDDVPGVYLYALATEPRCRGAGVMSALMAHSEALAQGWGAAFAVLIPATATLYPYYQKRGYVKRLRLRHVRLAFAGGNVGDDAPEDMTRLGNEPDDAFGSKNQSIIGSIPINKTTKAAPFNQEPPTAVRLAQLRGQWLPGPVLRFCGTRAELVAQDVAGAGAMLAVGEEAYAVALPGKSVLLAAELAGRNDEAVLHLLRAIMAAHGLRQARVTLPFSPQLLAGRGVARPAALLKPLSGAFRFDEQSYLRFAMDEPFVFGLPRA